MEELREEARDERQGRGRDGRIIGYTGAILAPGASTRTEGGLLGL